MSDGDAATGAAEAAVIHDGRVRIEGGQVKP